eukprot:6521249-Karenia_brevis.AAC.1
MADFGSQWLGNADLQWEQECAGVLTVFEAKTLGGQATPVPLSWPQPGRAQEHGERRREPRGRLKQ